MRTRRRRECSGDENAEGRVPSKSKALIVGQGGWPQGEGISSKLRLRGSRNRERKSSTGLKHVIDHEF
jgi:hypothetical protein